eukprot:3944976-Pleurochrysis_carterae.AAC.1
MCTASTVAVDGQSGAGAAGVAGGDGDAAADNFAKGVVPAAYRKNLSAELQGHAYCTVKDRMLARHREGGADLEVDLLEIAVTGEPPEFCRASLERALHAYNAPQAGADGHSRCTSPLLLQLAWGTLSVDA